MTLEAVQMIAFAGSTTVWLLATNMLLGGVVLVCCILIAWNLFNDVRRMRKEKKDEGSIPVDYLESLADLGVTISAGKKQIDEMEEV
jgi:hypothetical protein